MTKACTYRLYATRKRFRRPCSSGELYGSNGSNCSSLIKIQNGVELRAKISMEIVAHALGLGSVDHADGALKALLASVLKSLVAQIYKKLL